MGSAQQSLEIWLDRLAGRFRSAGFGVDLVADDRLLGDALAAVVTIDAATCELVAVRSKRRHAHVAVFAETAAAADRLAGALEEAWRATSRFANAERKFVHRLARVARQLADTFAAREPGYPGEELRRLQQVAPGARPMLGCGYHVEIAGEAQDDDAGDARHRYDPLIAASVPLGAQRRAILFSPARRAFVAPASATQALGLSRPETAPAFGLAIVGTAAAATAAAIAAADAAALAPPPPPAQQEQSAGETVLEATSEAFCELPQFLVGLGDCLPDVSSCVPDCGSFDVPDCDCGGCDL